MSRSRTASTSLLAVVVAVGLLAPGCAPILPEKHSLTVAVEGPGAVEPESGEYDAGSVVCLNAIPEKKCRLASWSGSDDDASVANTNSVTIRGDTTVTARFESIPVEPDLAELTAVTNEMSAAAERLKTALSSPPGRYTDVEDLVHAVGMASGIANEIVAFEKRAGRVMDDAVEARLRDSDASIAPTLEALGEVKEAAADLMKEVDAFFGSGLAEVAAAEFRDAIGDIRDHLRDAIFLSDASYIGRYIPVRFVQFVETESDFLSDEYLERDIDRTNEIFRAVRVRFYLRANIAVFGSDFVDIYTIDSQGKRKHVPYTWPSDFRQSPLIWPLIWSQAAGCPDFQPPADGTESRYDAQMRAGTYCCPRDEMLVYINQGVSNGGQYPWYSRIVGMSSYHMGGNTFAHEVGHYLGLPHTFPSHKHYRLDYDLARIVTPPPDGEEPLGRRLYEPHANLVNPETGQMAELSLFWDMVFRPGCVDSPHVFFESRDEAAAHERNLQPMQQWLNAHICLPFDSGCADPASPFTVMEMTIAAGCSGPPKTYDRCSFGTGVIQCISPVRPIYTGDDRLDAFSRFGSSIGRLRSNVMSYGFLRADGTKLPGGIFERPFISASQIEQIERVFEHDVETRYFPGQTGLRPELGLRFVEAAVDPGND